MFNVHHIRSGVTHCLGELRERSSHVRNFDAHANEPAFAHQVAHENARQNARVDVATAEHNAHCFAFELLAVLQQRSDAGRTCAFGHRLFDFDQKCDGFFNRRFVNEQHVLYQRPRNRHRHFARVADCQTFGNRFRAHVHRFATQSLRHRRERFRFNANDLNARLHPMRRDRTTGDQTAATDRNNQRVELWRGFEHFERERALPRDDVRIIVRMHEHELMFRRQRARMLRSFRQGVAEEHHLGAVALGVAHLHEWRVGGHNNRRGNAKPPGVIRHALRVVARAHRDHATRFFCSREREQFVQRAALFEARSELQIFKLQPHVATENARQRF